MTKWWLRYLSFSLKSSSKRKKYSMHYHFLSLSLSNLSNKSLLNLQYRLLQKNNCVILKKARCYQKQLDLVQLNHRRCLTRRILRRPLDAHERVVPKGRTKYCAKFQLALFSSQLWKNSWIFPLRTTLVRQRVWSIPISGVSK